MTQAIRQVVLTRAPEDNESLKRTLGTIDASLIDYPCIRTEFLSIDDAIRARLEDGRYRTAIFVSRNGVRGLLRHFFSTPRAVIALGPGTAREVVAHGWKVTGIPSEPLAAVLAREVEPLVAPFGRILYVRAEVGSTAVPERLRTLGREVDEALVYRTVDPVTAPITFTPGLTLFVFASPSAIHHFTTHNPVPRDAIALCIGPTTARAAKEHGFTRIEETLSSETDDFAHDIHRLCQSAGKTP